MEHLLKTNIMNSFDRLKKLLNNSDEIESVTVSFKNGNATILTVKEEEEVNNLIIGKYYRGTSGMSTICYQGNGFAFGLCAAMGQPKTWYKNDQWGIHSESAKGWEEISKEEWENNLLEYAKTKGYKNGNYKCLVMPNGTNKIENLDRFFIVEGSVWHGTIHVNCNMVMNSQGDWAEIIEKPTIKLPTKPQDIRPKESWFLKMNGAIASDEPSGLVDRYRYYNFHTEERAKEVKAYNELIRLVDEWNELLEWDRSTPCIKVLYGRCVKTNSISPISFDCMEIAEKFRETFKDLIEEAGELMY
jgi:hypothetical protein